MEEMGKMEEMEKMEKKARIETQHNKVPIWVALLWGGFAVWGFSYLVLYWAPDLWLWMSGEDPDKAQWLLLNK
ncbi:MAG: hypothetical protein V3W31_04765 [Thermodesulfobacteriota bacterium]